MVRMESKYGEDGKYVGVRCAMAQGGSCGVMTHGTTRVHAQDAPTRSTVTWVPSLDTATEYSHRVLSQATHHMVSTQDTVTGYRHRAPVTGSTATNLCHESLPRLNVTAAYKQRHPG